MKPSVRLYLAYEICDKPTCKIIQIIHWNLNSNMVTAGQVKIFST